ncbi:MAG: hypothetical protein Q7K40_04970 [bacterium]|nr:hypothetical protein [bacterium]
MNDKQLMTEYLYVMSVFRFIGERIVQPDLVKRAVDATNGWSEHGRIDTLANFDMGDREFVLYIPDNEWFERNPDKACWINNVIDELQNLAGKIARAKMDSRFRDDFSDMEHFYQQIERGTRRDDLAGPRCNKCGRIELQAEDVERYLADEYATSGLIDAYREHKVEQFAETIINANIKDLYPNERTQLMAALEKGNVQLVNVATPLKECLECSGMEFEYVYISCDFSESKCTILDINAHVAEVNATG